MSHSSTLALALLGLALLTFTALSASAGEMPTERNWVRVTINDGDHIQSARALDYGRFVWVPASDPALATLRDAGTEIRMAKNAFELDLGGHRFDPLLDGLPAALLGTPWRSAPGSDWRLVQFHGPVRQAWLDELVANGIEPVQYIYPHSYVVWSTPAALARASGSPSVRWAGEFLPDFRMAPVFRRQGHERIAVNLMVRSGLQSDLREMLNQLGADALADGRIDRHFHQIDIEVEADQLARIAAIPGVYSVQPVALDGGTRSEMSVQINHDNVDIDGLAQPGYLDFLQKLGLDGSGVIMACVDNGIQENHPDLVNRIINCTGVSCGSGSQSADGHGTHVGGIMAADGSSGTTNANGFLRGLGMAPGSQLVNQITSAPPPQMLNLMRDSVRNGAVISNNSWGPSGSPLGYDNNTRQVDIGVRDADVDTADDVPLSYILAIMNGGGGTSSQGTPDEGKNLFTIGSTWAQVNANTQDMRNDEISANSAHGPALDGRTIPHMVAASRFSDSPLGATGYGLQGGTSQAAPHVAGAVALFTEYYRDLFQTDPSPALVKAAFLPVARDLEGNNDANDNPIGARPDSKQGWGRMQTHPVLDPQLPVTYIDQTHVFGETGQSWQTEFQAANPGEPMRLMLVWTDAPGHGLGGSTPAWNNDLDLRVAVGGSLYLGNVFEDGWSTTGGTADHRNNTEGVFLQPGQHQGMIEVEVLAADINSNALPNAGDNNAQDFALVCYNCIEMGASGSDLAVGLSALPDPVLAGDTLTWVIQAVNFGPEASTEVTVEFELPEQVTFLESRSLPVRSGQWQCHRDKLTVTCLLEDGLAAPSLAPPLKIEAVVDPEAGNSQIISQAIISGPLDDPDPDNNMASLATVVITDIDLIFSDRLESSVD